MANKRRQKSNKKSCELGTNCPYQVRIRAVKARFVRDVMHTCRLLGLWSQKFVRMKEIVNDVPIKARPYFYYSLEGNLAYPCMHVTMLSVV